MHTVHVIDKILEGLRTESLPQHHTDHPRMVVLVFHVFLEGPGCLQGGAGCIPFGICNWHVFTFLAAMHSHVWDCLGSKRPLPLSQIICVSF